MNEQLLSIIQAFIIGFIVCGLFIIIGSSIMSKREKHRAKKGDKWSCQISGHYLPKPTNILPMPPVKPAKDDLCKHKEYLQELSDFIQDIECLTEIEKHWLYTTAFTYLHGDKDHCDCTEELEGIIEKLLKENDNESKKATK